MTTSAYPHSPPILYGLVDTEPLNQRILFSKPLPNRTGPNRKGRRRQEALERKTRAH